ncbi:uncharacterized protein [Triticum aestivum]|uniref:uncharacterized protein isoform X1 n=1 Tax=Triticum aestivum TaxID=4565 RepID=UPI001D02CACC|nr:uncharacterized protein LOC123121059 isoform X1 [Triticum aestivum]
MAASTSCKKKSNSPSPGGPSLLPHPCESKTTEGEAMVANGSVAMCDEQVQNGLEFLLDPVDRFPLTEVTTDVERPDPLVLMDIRHSAPETADSSCAIVVGHIGTSFEHIRAPCKRPLSPTKSAESTGKVNPEAPGWTRRHVSDSEIFLESHKFRKLVENPVTKNL